MILLSGAALAALGASAVLAQAGQPAAATAQASMTMPDNILLADWPGAFDGLPPFDRVTPELFPAAFEFAIGEQRFPAQWDPKLGIHVT